MTFFKRAPTFPFLRTKAQYEGGGRILLGDGMRSDRSGSSALECVLYLESSSIKFHLHWTVRDFTIAFVGERQPTAYLRQKGVDLYSDGRIMNWTRIGVERSCTAPAYAKRD
jgi:hypothetical protein